MNLTENQANVVTVMREWASAARGEYPDGRTVEGATLFFANLLDGTEDSGSLDQMRFELGLCPNGNGVFAADDAPCC